MGVKSQEEKLKKSKKFLPQRATEGREKIIGHGLTRINTDY